MSKSRKLNNAQRDLAKRLGITPQTLQSKKAEVDPPGKTPVFSPALALLLSSVHGQEITDGVVSHDGWFGVAFATNDVVEDALANFEVIKDSFKENEMPYHEVICRYLRYVSGRENCSMVRMLEADHGHRLQQSDIGKTTHVKSK